MWFRIISILCGIMTQSPDEFLDDLYKWVQNETKGVGKPFMITEIGAGGLYGYRKQL